MTGAEGAAALCCGQCIFRRGRVLHAAGRWSSTSPIPTPPTPQMNSFPPRLGVTGDRRPLDMSIPPGGIDIGDFGVESRQQKACQDLTSP